MNERGERERERGEREREREQITNILLDNDTKLKR